MQFIIFHLGPELDNQIAIVDSWSFMGTKTVERSNEKREKEFSRKGHRKVLTFDPDECFTLEMGQMNTRCPSTIIGSRSIDRHQLLVH